MFELPELITIARQMNQLLPGARVERGRLGNSPHKFVWYNRSHEEFARLVSGATVGPAWVEGKWLFVPLEPDYVLLIGEWGGRVLYHRTGAKPPARYHLLIDFVDGSHLSATTQMWGAAELWEKGHEHEGRHTKDMRVTPVEPAFTVEYLADLIGVSLRAGKRSVKGLLTQDQLVPGLGNAIAQDIMFRAGLHPRHDVSLLDDADVRRLHAAITSTVAKVIAGSGRYDERDLHGRQGGYVRVMDAKSVGQPCPECGAAIQKLQYLGGACYLCAECQT